MRSHGSIESLLQDARIWQAGRPSRASRSRLPSGWPALDRVLGGGWPLGELTELLVGEQGIGELSLLLPALSRLTRQPDEPGGESRWVTLVAPPYMPYAPALEQAGLDLARLLVVQARQDLDAFWAIEQALHSRSCGAVIGWSDTDDDRALRRLQLAAEASGAWLVLFRGLKRQLTPSPAPLRIVLGRTRAGQRYLLRILKRRGGPPVVADIRDRD